MRRLTNIRVIAKMTMLEAARGNIIRVLALISLAIMVANIFFTELFAWSLGKVSVEFGLTVSALTGLLIIFFLVLRLLYNDLENHTVYFLFSRPISSADYIVGKYLGFAILLLVAIAIIGLGSAISFKYIAWQYPAFISPLFSWSTFFLAFIYQFLGLLVTLAVSFFWFSYMTESFVALILSIFTYHISQNMELIRRLFVDSYQENNIEQISAIIAKGLTYLLPNLNFFNLKSQAAYGLPISASSLSFVFIYGCSYIALLLTGATYFFSKRKNL